MAFFSRSTWVVVLSFTFRRVQCSAMFSSLAEVVSWFVFALAQLSGDLHLTQSSLPACCSIIPSFEDFASFLPQIASNCIPEELPASHPAVQG
uniref:Putative secreted protein n=1 Tax=Anopheles darlingi TaxID=43151 RepID=A0A2M4D9R1_ANODA